MTDSRLCPTCGEGLHTGAQFCPRCGTRVAALPATPPTPAASPQALPAAPPSRRTYFIWVPLAMVALALLAWAVLSGLPFSREPREPARPAPVVVEERQAPTTTVSQIGEVSEVRAKPAPRPVTRRAEPTPTPPTPRASRAEPEIAETEAIATLRSFIVSRPDYGVTGDCVSVSSLGYRNTGYTLEARNRCDQKSLGRWRVDAKTRSVFREQPDGRYLRP